MRMNLETEFVAGEYTPQLSAPAADVQVPRLTKLRQQNNSIEALRVGNSIGGA